MQKQDKNWSSLDIHEAAYLTYHGISVDLAQINDRIVFTAPQSEELFALVAAYLSNDPIPIFDFVTTLKAMKTRLFVAKGLSK